MVRSETEVLKSVVIHEPDMGIDYISPEMAEQLLYDDIVFLPRMVEEHFAFTEALRFIIGKENVHEFEVLLADILHDSWVVSDLLAFISQVEPLEPSVQQQLQSFSASELAFTLITGLHPVTRKVLLKPIPNLVFTRDLGCVVNDHIIICKTNMPARWRESMLTKFIVHHHPLFHSFRDKILDFCQSEYFSKESDIAIEGGDIMLVHSDFLLVGISERTSEKGFELLKKTLFERGVVKNVVAVYLPEDRYCMHLDTVFTCVDEQTCVGFESLVFQPNQDVEVRRFQTGDFRVILYPSLKELMEEIYPGIHCLPCGNGLEPFASREQWTDGCNLVAVGKGVAFSYERNLHTLRAFRKAGFSVSDVKHLMNEYSRLTPYLEKAEKEIITFSSAELSRARGGAHCMTFPIKRG
jgi:arginine deiminase